MELTKPWSKDYIDVLSVWVDDDELVEELVKTFPLLAKKCPTCPSEFDQNYRVWRSEGFYTYDGQKLPCNCVHQNRLHFLYSLSGIGIDYQRLDWSDVKIEDKDILNPIINYLTHYDSYLREGVGLFLHGTAGTGKTLLANLIAKEFVKLGKSVRVFNFSNLLDSYTAGWKDNSAKARHEHMIKNADLLVIDDIGKELSDRLGAAQLDAALRVRYSHSRPTILTSNLSKAKIEANYKSEFITSLISGSMIDIMFTGGRDFRPRDLEARLARINNNSIRPIV